MSEKWPSAEEVERAANNAEHSPHTAGVYLLKFATLLRQMESAGSPQTDALSKKQADEQLHPDDPEARTVELNHWQEVFALCRHFESERGAIEARAVEKDEDDRVTAENELLALLAFLINEPVVGRAAKVEKEIVARIDAIRAFAKPPFTERRKGERRKDNVTVVNGIPRRKDRRQP